MYVALHEVTQHGARLCRVWALKAWIKLQALVQDILPSSTAIADYAIGLGKLSAANKQLSDGAQTAVNF